MVRGLKYIGAALTVGPIVAVLRLASVSYAGVAAPLLLLDVVVVARLWGTGPALIAAASALISVGVWRQTSELSGEGRRELLQVIDEESDRLNRFIEGLSTGDPAGPVQPIHLRTVRVDDVVRSGLHRADTVTRDHRVVVTLGDALPAVSVDASSISEVMYILLDNASKYAPSGTTITVHAARDDDRHVRITVSDQGPGIPEDLRERVFEKFFRVPGRESHDPHRGGIGLGLPIARRLVETQAGRIWMETPPGGIGTAVVMTLPTGFEPADADRPVTVVTAGKQ